jgi:tRNA-specific 2-thiouridylase
MTTRAANNGANGRGLDNLNALGFAKPPAETRVVVAMSGGVDSSVTAALLHEQGFDVIGITLQLYDHGVAVQTKGACCAGADIHDARSVAARLGIPHYVLDYENRFHEQVMQDFADSYLRGETPIPCVRCNQTVKFTDLLKTAHDLGADCLATGHYVQRTVGDDGPVLLRGVDLTKDQSYFLFATTGEQLNYLRFPLGGMAKDKTRALARKFGLAVAEKPDSQDICFVPNGRYGDVVRRLRPGAVDAGDIVHIDGSVLGRHDGVIDYTIGQRRGLGIGGRAGCGDADGPLYVLEIDTDANRVIVGPHEALACREVYLSDINWINAVPDDGAAILARLRNTAPAMPARIFKKPAGSDSLMLQLDEAQFGIATGQAAAFYEYTNPNHLLGGGWISHAPLIADKKINRK